MTKPEYVIHHCRVRERRGMPCWGVERVGEAIMLAAFHTEQEAKDFIAKQKENGR